MVRIKVKPIELQAQRDSLERKGIQGSLRRERGDGGEVSEKSPKTQPPTEGVGGAVPPEEATERPQAPTSLRLMSSFTSVRGLGSSLTFQFSHRPTT